MAQMYTKEKLKELPGLTQAGKDWSAKYLHPPAVTGNDFCGIPDDNNTPSAMMEYRMTNDCLPVLDGDNSHCLFLMSSSIKFPYYQALSIGPDNGDNQWACDNATYAFSNPSLDIVANSRNLGSIREVAASKTCYLLTNELTNKGTVSCAQFRPDIQIITGATLSMLTERFSHASNSQELNNNLTALFKRLSVDDTYGFEKLSLKPQAPRITTIDLQIIRLGEKVRTPGQLTQLSPKSVQHMAKDGLFTVHHYSQPAVAFKSLSIGSAAARAPLATNLYYCLYEQYDSIGQVQIKFFSTDGTGTQASALQDMPWSDMTWSYVFFNQLDAVSRVTVKNVMNWEVQPYVGSVLSPFTRSPAIPDRSAMDGAVLAAHGMPDGLIASMNDEDDAVKVINETEVSPGVIPAINNMVKSEPEHMSATVAKEARKEVDNRIKGAQKTAGKIRNKGQGRPRPTGGNRKQVAGKRVVPGKDVRSITLKGNAKGSKQPNRNRRNGQKQKRRPNPNTDLNGAGELKITN
jgi:hypothetical protein